MSGKTLSELYQCICLGQAGQPIRAMLVLLFARDDKTFKLYINGPCGLGQRSQYGEHVG